MPQIIVQSLRPVTFRVTAPANWESLSEAELKTYAEKQIRAQNPDEIDFLSDQISVSGPQGSTTKFNSPAFTAFTQDRRQRENMGLKVIAKVRNLEAERALSNFDFSEYGEITVICDWGKPSGDLHQCRIYLTTPNRGSQPHDFQVTFYPESSIIRSTELKPA